MKKTQSSLNSVVSILNDGKYHDGTSIGKKLGITRSAVWKAIQKLVSYGIAVDSIKGKGYSFIEPLILLNEETIKRSVNDMNLQIEVIECIDSTNEYLKNAIGVRKPKICIAELQTKGRGRLNRNWSSPFAQNVYLSIIYLFYKDSSELAGLTLVIGLSIINALKQYNLGEVLQIKWPNDIVFESKKLAGSLIETQSEANGISYAIIGIGLNVNMLKDKSISQPWTSLRKILGTYIDRNQLCTDLINNIILGAVPDNIKIC